MARVFVAIHALGAGGAERVTLQFAKWLLEDGHEVVIHTSCHAVADFYPLPTGLERCQESCLPSPLQCLGPLVFPLRVWRLRRLLQAEGFDVAIGITTLPAIKLLLAAWGISLPVIVSERIFPGSSFLPPPWRWLRSMTYPRADLHLVQTEAIANWLRQRRLASRIAVLPNSIPWPLKEHPPKVDICENLDPGDRLVLAVGTKPYQKGFDRLVAAFANVSKRRPGWRLAIAGLSTGDWPGYWPPLPSGPSAPLLLGRIGNLAEWYERADLFVLSSRSEGIPNVLLEAMACGCACVSVDCPTGPAELIQHGRSGWLLPKDSDVEVLTGAIEKLIDAPALRTVLGQGALAVRERFSEQHIRNQFLAILSLWLSPVSPGMPVSPTGFKPSP
ncbi:glycosyltransferase [Prochlorococcus marinus]|uniref:glycosyltransferase n=1 Tax=Prochlorococcus marinus TaxID=1219 RepID=UPI0007B3F325|nr:glycosyltransferase [Prochlorococcus marinus]KZR73743.1 Protein Glycosylation H [Prochlorococcus marinus str. MIT 1320]